MVGFWFGVSLGLAALSFASRRFGCGALGLGPGGGFGGLSFGADAGEFFGRAPFGCRPGFGSACACLGVVGFAGAGWDRADPGA